MGRSRLGVSLMEVVFAVVILAMVASTVVGAMGYLYSRQRVEQQRLGAAELANRLALSYLDDANAMPSTSVPIPYADASYRWSVDIDDVGLEESDSVVAAKRASNRRVSLKIDRLKQITIRVWLGEESGGAYGYDTDLPHAVIVRLYDPLNIARNPDSAERLFDTDAGFADIVNNVLNSMDTTPREDR